MTTVGEHHQYQDLITIFNGLFRDKHRTVLVRGQQEPLYQPASKPGVLHQVIFAKGYYASALHEISHWCIAGEQRRLLLDYGYWYCADGRSSDRQQEFERVEIKPQALEWIFSVAAGHSFHISVDNLGGEAYNRPLFEAEIKRQILSYLKEGMPRRAKQFVQALLEYYGRELKIEDFELEKL